MLSALYSLSDFIQNSYEVDPIFFFLPCFTNGQIRIKELRDFHKFGRIRCIWINLSPGLWLQKERASDPLQANTNLLELRRELLRKRKS